MPRILTWDAPEKQIFSQSSTDQPTEDAFPLCEELSVLLPVYAPLGQTLPNVARRRVLADTVILRSFTVVLN